MKKSKKPNPAKSEMGPRRGPGNKQIDLMAAPGRGPFAATKDKLEALQSGFIFSTTAPPHLLTVLQGEGWD